jgi:hypothetical protein
VKSTARVVSIGDPQGYGIRYAALEINHSLYDTEVKTPAPIGLPAEKTRDNRWPIGVKGACWHGDSATLPEDVKVGDEIPVRYIYAGYWGVDREFSRQYWADYYSKKRED